MAGAIGQPQVAMHHNLPHFFLVSECDRSRASVKLFELGVRTPGGLFLGVWYAGGIDFLRRTRSVPIFGIISDLLETTKPTSKYILSD